MTLKNRYNIQSNRLRTTFFYQILLNRRLVVKDWLGPSFSSDIVTCGLNANLVNTLQTSQPESDVTSANRLRGLDKK
jgi:hypothetical protein